MPCLDMIHLLFIFTERSSLEQGLKIGEHVIPLARNFNGVDMDLESGERDKVCGYIWNLNELLLLLLLLLRRLLIIIITKYLKRFFM